jgi:hypothetical protein
MPQQKDLFGFTPAQGSLFGEGKDRLQPLLQRTTPDPADIRKRLISLLSEARTSQRMPWSERDARMWQTVFPNMAKWLPAEEAEQLCFDFAREMERLKSAA